MSKNRRTCVVVGASSDKAAMVQIMRHLDDGYVLESYNLCRPGCPAAIHLHFRRKDRITEATDG